MLNPWPVCNRIIPNSWKDLVNRLLEIGTQLQWSTWLKEDAKIIEQQTKAREREIS